MSDYYHTRIAAHVAYAGLPPWEGSYTNPAAPIFNLVQHLVKKGHTFILQPLDGGGWTCEVSGHRADAGTPIMAMCLAVDVLLSGPQEVPHD